MYGICVWYLLMFESSWCGNIELFIWSLPLSSLSLLISQPLVCFFPVFSEHTLMSRHQLNMSSSILLTVTLLFVVFIAVTAECQFASDLIFILIVIMVLVWVFLTLVWDPQITTIQFKCITFLPDFWLLVHSEPHPSATPMVVSSTNASSPSPKKSRALEIVLLSGRSPGILLG